MSEQLVRRKISEGSCWREVDGGVDERKSRGKLPEGKFWGREVFREEGCGSKLTFGGEGDVAGVLGGTNFEEEKNTYILLAGGAKE